MSKLLITTQVYENYAWREDGSLGIGPEAYWKAKGGNDYVVLDVDVNRVQDIATAAVQQVEQANDYYTETVIHWQVVPDDYLTEFERDQLEYEGRVVYPARVLELEIA